MAKPKQKAPAKKRSRANRVKAKLRRKRTKQVLRVTRGERKISH